jgi:EAL domain-containing protein (putative c-di-GMP-specific phosphodiesterase class I)/GGDEF domain-containing protein
MDCCKGFNCLDIVFKYFSRVSAVFYPNCYIAKAYFKARYSRGRFSSLLLLSGLLFPFSVVAEQNSNLYSISVIPFLVGLSVPLIAFFCWKMFSKSAKGHNDILLTPNTSVNYPRDAATNLPIASQALKQFEHVLKTKKDSKLAAIVFKPINFQQVNTILGRHNSDILLLQLALCLKKSVSENPNLIDFDNNATSVKIARLHGLDFLVVFDLSNTKHEVKSIVDELCHQLAKAVPDAMSFKSFSLNFELAFGVAISKEHGNSVEEIVSHATDALLKGVDSGQVIQYFDNNSIFYTEQKLRLMECLRQDIVDENLHWYLQPQVDINDHAIIGFELKVNWHTNDGKVLELADFINLAEHSGDVYCLTKQMFKQAFKALFSLHKIGVYSQVSVNLSSQNLLEPDLVDYIEQQMKNYNIAGKYLMIELDEQIMLCACQRAKNTIDQLKSLDITVAIDNFSGSYESLRYLRKMVIDQVKINCQDLDTSDDNKADKAIINALITFTHSMKLPLIGTHIDNSETANSYISMGGSLIQGEMIHKGVNPSEIEPWLKNWYIKHPKAKPNRS